MKTTLYKTAVVLLLSVFLTHCSWRRVDVDEEVRQPAEQAESVIQITPMAPEAVQDLIRQADQQLQQGAHGAALLTLRRALNISPQSPLVQQHLAEVYLSDGQYQEAFNWSTLVVDQGPDFGPLCERSRRTLALAAEMLADVSTQSRALQSIATCSQKQAPRF
jgi:lipopolysaccharide biosynthesis regulator YciM